MTCKLDPVTGPVGVPDTFYCYECMAWHRGKAPVSNEGGSIAPNVLLKIEHTRMLNYLKARFSEHDGGRQEVWDLIHGIDPEWPNPWMNREPEIMNRKHAEVFYREGDHARASRRHGEVIVPNPYAEDCIAGRMWAAGFRGDALAASLNNHYGLEKE